ncbi:hypothetical protein Q8W71_07770 [Methylobacterium sp. NEAU 140]|uniref:hypothetical protein n=1 Tax=Methylobacterium sp. NEAU 140 TaxID=3064945 RepID=UPI0027341C6E|nr:hypothetical protein [Methylobacterium sp. NEAU 140]MDP4022516.1 hypothetical protein [Methylobacterium sp. NEAU 140]
MAFRLTRAAAVVAATALLAGTAVHVQAAELSFFEMLFGARPAPQAPQAAPDPGGLSRQGQDYRRARARVGETRHRLRTRYAALPVKIRVKEPVSERQTPLDMSQGAAAALMKDETLRPGDIVVLNTGARVFTGNPDKRHRMSDFEPVQRSPYVSKTTRKLLAGMMTPVGALPADEARRVLARMRKATPASEPVVTQAATMRVINPWQAP